MTVLAIPDPRTSPIPAGWLEHEAAPAILATEEWEALDEYEARLRAFASYIASFHGDALEYEKALRLVEKRRGDLLAGGLGSNTRVSDTSSEMTRSRWRKISAHWDEVWPAILHARSRGEVTQAAVLRRIDGAQGGGRVCECCGRRL